MTETLFASSVCALDWVKRQIEAHDLEVELDCAGTSFESSTCPNQCRIEARPGFTPPRPRLSVVDRPLGDPEVVGDQRERHHTALRDHGRPSPGYWHDEHPSAAKSPLRSRVNLSSPIPLSENLRSGSLGKGVVRYGQRGLCHRSPVSVRFSSRRRARRPREQFPSPFAESAISCRSNAKRDRNTLCLIA
jgi:hypothetical protein